MASAISGFINQIKNAVYGEQVRGAIVSALEACYSDVNSPSLQSEGFAEALNAAYAGGILDIQTVTTISAMTNDKIIYRYNGTETGKQKGLYYYSSLASAWVLIGSEIQSVTNVNQMTDHDAIYKYVGTQTGMIQNSLYCYNGTEWVPIGSGVLSVSLASQMTNTGVIYKYTGNEEGYSTNALYFYDGTSWQPIATKYELLELSNQILAMQGDFSKSKFTKVEKKAVINLLLKAVYEEDVSDEIAALAGSWGISTDEEGDVLADYVFGLSIPNGLETYFNFTPSDTFDICEFIADVPENVDTSTTKYLGGGNASGHETWSVTGDNFVVAVSSANKTDVFNKTFAQVRGAGPTAFNVERTGWPSTKYMNSVHIGEATSVALPILGMTLYGIKLYKDNVVVADLSSTGVVGQFRDRISSNVVTFSNTTGMTIVEVE